MSKPLFHIAALDVVNNDNKYTKKINVPQYMPSKVCPKLYELCDTKKYKELLTQINTSNITEEEKEFLRLAATRHIVFNYAKIADYYAHAEPVLQKLMENSALVIIDVDDAIANGYVKLSKEISKMIEENNL